MLAAGPSDTQMPAGGEVRCSERDDPFAGFPMRMGWDKEETLNSIETILMQWPIFTDFPASHQISGSVIFVREQSFT